MKERNEGYFSDNTERFNLKKLNRQRVESSNVLKSQTGSQL
jgi:hypothetical protein